jgi:hypothetical protein
MCGAQAILLAQWWLSARTLGIALWAGLAVLTLSLLVLMRTRWGQAQPLSKCVVLSMFAHVLFGAYAYGTRLVFDYPTAAEGEAINLSIVGLADDSLEHAEHSNQMTMPWQRFVADGTMRPEIVDLQRRVTEMADHQPQHESVPLPVTDALPLAEATPTIVPTRPTPDVPNLDVLRTNQPGLAATEMEAPAPEPVEDSEPIDPIGPTADQLQRMRPTDVSAAAPQKSAAPDLPSQLVEIDSRLQRLTDVQVRSQSADAVSGPREQLNQAENDRERTSKNNNRRDQDEPSADAETISPNDSTSGLVASNARRNSTAVADRDQRSSSAATSNTDAASPPRRFGDGAEVPGLYRVRVSSERARFGERHGGNARTEAAVEAALKWLAANQSADGRWDASAFEAGREWKVLGHDRNGAGAEADTGVTALALLAMLGAGHSHLEGQYRKNVQYGLEFLLHSQRPDGNLAGDARLFARMYCHGMATLALCEAYAVTGDHRIRPFAERAVQYTIDSQHSTSGGWRYQPGDQGDMSQFGWQVMALKSAELAGIEVPSRTRDGMLRFLRSTTSGTYSGLASYRPGERPSRTMTAEALTCRFFLDLEPDSATLREGIAFIMQELPADGKANCYFWYYATLALFHAQDNSWDVWNEALQQQLLRRQQTESSLAGSWDPDTVWGGYGGRVYTTAMAALCLEVYYRYLPQ